MKANWSATAATAIRLMPGDDLRAKLTEFAIANELEAAVIIAAVGSLTEVTLRLANRTELTHYTGKHEIVSLAGTLSQHGLHLHMSVANNNGLVIGGHVVDGSIVYTTAEVVIAKLNSVVFRRKQCPKSGFRELVVEPRPDGD